MKKIIFQTILIVIIVFNFIIVIAGVFLIGNAAIEYTEAYLPTIIIAFSILAILSIVIAVAGSSKKNNYN